MNMRILGRYTRWILLGLAVAALLAVAFWPRPALVDTAAVARGPMRVTLDDEGETRIRNRYVVSTPVAGRVERIDLEPGDLVTRNQTIVARVRPEVPVLLDARSRAEAEAALSAARASLGSAEAEEKRAHTALGLAQTELARVKNLVDGGAMPRRELDVREADARTAEEQERAATYAVAGARAELQRAQARLRSGGGDRAPAPVTIQAPIDGVVLKRLRESESVVPAGDPLVELGNPEDLEIVSDLLSTDAVRVPPSARVLIVEWGGAELEARVRRVEPAGFTKISALGVEEQRVNVIMDFVDPRAAWARLGDAYRVEVRVVLWEADAVLKVPTSALFRVGDDWAVYAMEDGRARRTVVQLGQRNAEEAEVTGGLAEGATVVIHPSDTLTDGARIARRP